MLINTEAFVLKNRKYGETDSLLTLFTRKLGKVNVIAKGARRPKSTLLAGIQPFGYSEFVLYKGKSLYTVNQCESKRIFYGIREDLTRLTYGAYLLELVEVVTQEGQTNNRLFNLLGNTLVQMTQEDVILPTLVRAFELKLLICVGLKPHLKGCVSCGSTQFSPVRFSSEEGGILCPQCFSVDPHAMAVSETTIRLATFLMEKELRMVSKVRIKESLMMELKKLLKQYISVHLSQYPFQSLDMLDKLGMVE